MRPGGWGYHRPISSRIVALLPLLLTVALACSPRDVSSGAGSALGANSARGGSDSGPNAVGEYPAAYPWGQPTKTTGCTAARGDPDAACTPGAIDPRVTSENAQQTICVSGYSTQHRPPVRLTEPLKQRLVPAYGRYAGRGLGGYELDHLVPISLGGALNDAANLWPEAHSWADGSLGSFTKDDLEYTMYKAVCDGQVGLDDARASIAHDWVATYQHPPVPLVHNPAGSED